MLYKVRLLASSHRRFQSELGRAAAARQRLIELIRRAAEKPKRRRQTKPSLASKQRRLETKRRRSQLKRLRQGTE